VRACARRSALPAGLVQGVRAANQNAYRSETRVSGVLDCAQLAEEFPDAAVVNAPCVRNTDCEGDYTCVEHKCGPALRQGEACADTAECGSNFECAVIGGKQQCYFPRREGYLCDADSYCYRELVCTNGRCATPGPTCNGGCGPCQYFGSDVCCYTCESGGCVQKCSF